MDLVLNRTGWWQYYITDPALNAGKKLCLTAG